MQTKDIVTLIKKVSRTVEIPRARVKPSAKIYSRKKKSTQW